MEVYIIRHTAVAVAKGVCYGQTDVALDPHYIHHIEAIKTKLPHNFDKIFSSPSTRCRILAEQLSNDPIEFIADLMEMNFGQWENKTWDSIESLALNKWMNDFVYTKTPDGENLEILYARVSLFMEFLRKGKYKKVALITHAGVIRCVWAYLLDIPLENIFKVSVNYGEGMLFNLGATKELDQIIKASI